jgi:uncharacterized membrane protein
MRSPFSLPQLLIFVLALGLLLALLQIKVITIAFDKLGLSQSSAFLLLIASLVGSAISLPLFMVKAEAPAEDTVYPPMKGLLRQQLQQFHGQTLITINVGGGLIPIAFSLYLLNLHHLPAFQTLAAITLVALVCYVISRPIPGLGIGMPIFVAPIAAAIVSIMLHPELSAPLAYISGTLGVLIGADLLRLPDIRRMGTPRASIGGAGTFDGIFLTGIVAVLLA